MCSIRYIRITSKLSKVHVDRENNDQYLGHSYTLASFYVHCQVLSSSVAQIGVDKVITPLAMSLEVIARARS